MRLKILAICLFAAVTALAQSSEADQVKACFRGYKSAILEKKGAVAAKFANQNTIDYYEKMRRVSLDADSAKTEDLELLDKILVLVVRHKLLRVDIEPLDGVGFFRYAIDMGMVGEESVKNLEIGVVEVKGNTAIGGITVGGGPTPLAFQFTKEGSWKIDITSIFDVTSTALAQVIQSSGATENEFIFQLLYQLNGESPGDSIWHPMK